MDKEEIIRRNKAKRHNYSRSNNDDNLTPKIKYVKGLISRVLLAIIFVLGSIIFTNISEENKKLYKSYVLEDSLKFNKINDLYKNLFGDIDIIKKNDKAQTVFKNNINYSNIEKYQNGVKLTTGINTPISVLASGIVVYIGEKDNLGSTVIVQGNDGYDIWYSNITDTDIKVYDYIENGSIIGTSNSDYIYVTIMKDGKYVEYSDYDKNI